VQASRPVQGRGGLGSSRRKHPCPTTPIDPPQAHTATSELITPQRIKPHHQKPPQAGTLQYTQRTPARSPRSPRAPSCRRSSAHTPGRRPACQSASAGWAGKGRAGRGSVSGRSRERSAESQFWAPAKLVVAAEPRRHRQAGRQEGLGACLVSLWPGAELGGQVGAEHACG